MYKRQAQLNTYLDLLKQVPYSPHSTMPDEDARTLLEQAMELNKFEVSEDKLGQIISLDRYQAILLTYYRNNIPVSYTHLDVYKRQG